MIGSATGALGIAALASIALGRPLLLMVAEHTAELNPDHQPEIRTRLAEPGRRRAMAILTAIIRLTFAIDGASQITLALTVPTATFVAYSTAARIIVLGTGMIVTTWYLRHQKGQRETADQRTSSPDFRSARLRASRCNPR